MHRVHADKQQGRIGECLVCIARLDTEIAARKAQEQAIPEQSNLFGGRG